MTQRYMDFAPVKKTTARGAGVSQGRAVPSKTVGMNNRRAVTSNSAVKKPVVARPAGAKSFDVRPTAKPAGVKTASARPAAVKLVTKRPATVRPMTTMPSAGAVPRSRMSMRTSSVRQTTSSKASVSVGRVATKKTVAPSKVKLGEIEDLSPKFVKKDVPKRPLNDGSELNKPKGAAEAKSKKIGGRLRLRSSKNNAKSKNEAVAGNKIGNTQNTSVKGQSAYTVPKSPFINQDKVTKRPLSRNIYHAPDEKALEMTSQMIDKKAGRKTTTIIDKPAKDSKIGMVVAIILTIILGAVAGTVAFLLLPK